MQLKVKKGYSIDHIDSDKSNNQRNNLRIATQRLQNYNSKIKITNTSGFEGVDFNKKRKSPWRARIILRSGAKFLGYFSTLKEASDAYRQAKEIRDKKEIEFCKN